MGTTRSGRYMNTHGSARHASEFAIIHSNEGTYKWSNPRYKQKKDSFGKWWAWSGWNESIKKIWN